MNRSALIITLMLASGILTIAAGTLVVGLIALPSLLLSDDPGFSISETGLLLTATLTASVTLAVVHLIILAMLLFPLRYFSKTKVAAKSLIIVSALAGGLVALAPVIYRAIDNLAYQNIPPTENSTTWTRPALLLLAGLLYGGFFGGFYCLFERLSGGLPTRVTPRQSTEKTTPNNTSSYAVIWFIVAILVISVVSFIWVGTTPLRLITAARNQALRHQDALLHEARQMLADTAASDNHYRDYGHFGKPLPETFAKLGDVRASTSGRYPGAVKVYVTGGFTHFGLYIIPDPTSATASLINPDKSIKVVNQHILQFSE